MNKKEILKKASSEASVLIRKYREEYASMLEAGWRGDIPARDEHRMVLEGMRPEIQATIGNIFNWAVSQLKPRYTGRAVAYGRGRGRVCAAPSYAAPVKWLSDVEARAVIRAPSCETYASQGEALSATIAQAGNSLCNGVSILVNDRPDPDDNWFSMTTVVETKGGSLKEAIQKADPKWGLSDFGPWEWAGEEISPETQAEVLLLQGESPFRGQYANGRWEFDIAVR